ncbi:hypothetical protein [Niabella hibiscisoli]|uniref:hypothetical protein n=1 Tax=Niabella hibiscisoli TaxID=1825928 RepID=UPI001F0D530A|nr:hypothetical protein [Niabella hibiscisoli]MCH5720131.1 hypothetical protein [Niabella hibiscisoli]
MKYIPKPGMTVVYLLLLGLVLLLFMGRSKMSLRSEILLSVYPDFYQHVSNFSISYMLFSIVGYMWLIMGVKLGKIMIAGVLIVLANFIYELFLPFINTKDIVDAYFGMGVLFWVVYSCTRQANTV